MSEIIEFPKIAKEQISGKRETKEVIVSTLCPICARPIKIDKIEVPITEHRECTEIGLENCYDCQSFLSEDGYILIGTDANQERSGKIVFIEKDEFMKIIDKDNPPDLNNHVLTIDDDLMSQIFVKQENVDENNQQEKPE